VRRHLRGGYRGGYDEEQRARTGKREWTAGKPLPRAGWRGDPWRFGRAPNGERTGGHGATAP